MQLRVYNLNTPWTDIQFIPEYKLSLWYGFGSDGKSALCEYLIHNSCNDFTYVCVNIPPYETDKIVIIDEDSLAIGSVIDNIKNSPNIFVILARSVTRVLNIHYRAIYIVKNLEATVFNVCRFTVERFFKDYNYLPKNVSYVIEDSGSGFQHARFWLNNVITSNGCENLYKYGDRVIIADGCGVARVLSKILEITQNIYLHDSFECAVAEYYQILPENFALISFNMEQDSPTIIIEYLDKKYAKKGILKDKLLQANIYNLDKPHGPNIPTLINILILFLSKHKEFRKIPLESSDKYCLPELQLIAIYKTDIGKSDYSIKSFYEQYYADSIGLFAKSKNLSRGEAIDYLLTLAPEVRLANKSDEDVANDVLRIIGFN